MFQKKLSKIKEVEQFSPENRHWHWIRNQLISYDPARGGSAASLFFPILGRY